MLTQLKIERFRGIPSLSLEDFSKVNIFIGGNGAGKTSVLESVFVVANPTSPDSPVRIGGWREMPSPNSVNHDSISCLFHRGDTSHGPTFQFTADDLKQKLSIENLTDTSGIQVPVDMAESSLEDATEEQLTRGLVFHFQPGRTNRDDYTSRLILIPNAPQLNIQKQFANKLGCFYIHARRATSVGEMATLLTRLSLNKKTDKFLTAMRAFDDRIVGIEAGFRGKTPTVLVDLGLPTKLPVNVLGDGFCRISLMVTGVFFTNSKILAVDEIDSGLHPSIMVAFWKNLVQLAADNKKQVFCTTHNEDMLSRTIEAFADSPESLRIFRIDRLKDGQLKATKYTYDSYRNAESMGLDIR